MELIRISRGKDGGDILQNRLSGDAPDAVDGDVEVCAFELLLGDIDNSAAVGVDKGEDLVVHGYQGSFVGMAVGLVIFGDVGMCRIQG